MDEEALFVNFVKVSSSPRTTHPKIASDVPGAVSAWHLLLYLGTPLADYSVASERSSARWWYGRARDQEGGRRGWVGPDQSLDSEGTPSFPRVCEPGIPYPWSQFRQTGLYPHLIELWVSEEFHLETQYCGSQMRLLTTDHSKLASAQAFNLQATAMTQIWNFPKLKGQENYHSWSKKMKSALKHSDLWKIGETMSGFWAIIYFHRQRWNRGQS